MNHTLSDSQLEAMIKSAVNSSGPLPPDEKFSQLISALRELQERRKAERDGEPVAWLWSRDDERDVSLTPPDDDDDTADAIECGWTATPLYRHAQPAAGHLSRICAESYQVVGVLAEALNIFNDLPVIKALDNLSAQELIHDDVLPFSVPEENKPAPVVPDFETVLESLDYDVRCNIRESEHVYQASKATYDACRAAMLNHPSSIKTNTDAAPGTEIKHPSSNSPVIPEGYVMVPKEPTAEMVIKMRYHVGGYDRNIKEGYKAMLAAAPQSLGSDPATVPGKWVPVSERMPDCWCRTCRPVVLNDMRFVVCPDCGNKRCPRANDHRNACTGSNEPGQEGSAYPDTPREVK